MRGALSIVIALAACKDEAPSAPRDAPPPDTAVDAATLPPCENPVAGARVSLRRITGKVYGIATLATAPPNDPRLFVLEAGGRIRIYKDETLMPEPFLDLSVDAGGPVVAGNELGLLGLAFHPRYADNGLFFIYYTTGALGNQTLRDVVVRCSVSASDPDRADASSCVEILSIADPGANHNGGMIEFGSDGYLYIGTGDGGGPNQLRHSQDPAILLGKMLRIDVDTPASGKAYGIPPGNPFAGGGGAPEVLMLGLRNPWRWSFDRATNDMWIGDVGRSEVEELTVVAPAEQPGANLGWSIYEGSSCFTPPCDPAGKLFPQDERERTSTGWAAIVAGQTYRGTCFPDLVGWHVYADNWTGKYVMARLRPDRTLETIDVTGELPPRPVSFHEDARGEIYMTDVSGYVYRVEAGP